MCVSGEPELLRDIETAKEAFYANNPGERALHNNNNDNNEVAQAPTRVLPERVRNTTDRFMFTIYGLNDCPVEANLLNSALRDFRHQSKI